MAITIKYRNPSKFLELINQNIFDETRHCFFLDTYARSISQLLNHYIEFFLQENGDNFRQSHAKEFNELTASINRFKANRYNCKNSKQLVIYSFKKNLHINSDYYSFWINHLRPFIQTKLMAYSTKLSVRARYFTLFSQENGIVSTPGVAAMSASTSTSSMMKR